MEELRVSLSVRMLPNDYTCDGENRSPQVSIGGVNPAISKSLAVNVSDPDSSEGGGFVHWIMWNMELVKTIPEEIPKTPEVSVPIRAVQGTNTFGKIGYSGPCPLMGRPIGISSRYTGLTRSLTFRRGPQKISWHGPCRAILSSTARPA